MPSASQPNAPFAWPPSPNQSPHRRYLCAWCGHRVSSHQGYAATRSSSRISAQTFLTAHISICPDCSRPTYFEGEAIPDAKELQLPAPMLGLDVQHLPPEVAALYNEARECSAAGAYTAAVLLARKLLMHVGVEQGAASNLNFVGFIDYLATKGFVPPNGRAWVDRIRQLGNEANHEIVLVDQAKAEEALLFLGWLLKFAYELPGTLPKTPP